MEIKFYGAFVLILRVNLHAIDAPPARWRGDAGSSPLDGASTAASSPRNDLVKNCRVQPTHFLISTQPAALVGFRFRLGRLGPGGGRLGPARAAAARHGKRSRFGSALGSKWRGVVPWSTVYARLRSRAAEKGENAGSMFTATVLSAAPRAIETASPQPARGREFGSDGLRRSASRDVARRTAVLRGRTTADRTDAVAGRGCEKTHVVVREGIPGRVINRSRRGRTRNIGKPCKIGLQAPLFFDAATRPN